jgi:hypothetical protein
MIDEAILKQMRAVGRYLKLQHGCVKMIEAVTAILVLFGAGIFVAHAVEAYLAP